MLVRPFHHFAYVTDEMEHLRKHLNRMLSDYAESGETTASQAWLPPLSLTESANAFHVRVMLPGIDPEKIKVEAEPKRLTLEGEWPQPEPRDGETLHLNEFRYGTFRRALEFKVPIAHEQIDAQYEHGILTLTVPKLETSEKKAVKVQITSR